MSGCLPNIERFFPMLSSKFMKSISGKKSGSHQLNEQKQLKLNCALEVVCVQQHDPYPILDVFFNVVISYHEIYIKSISEKNMDQINCMNRNG